MIDIKRYMHNAFILGLIVGGVLVWSAPKFWASVKPVLLSILS